MTPVCVNHRTRQHDANSFRHLGARPRQPGRDAGPGRAVRRLVGAQQALILEAERLGYDSTLVAQHTINPHHAPLDQLEAWTSSAALAALTSGSRSSRRSSRICIIRSCWPRWRCRSSTSAAAASPSIWSTPGTCRSWKRPASASPRTMNATPMAANGSRWWSR